MKLKRLPARFECRRCGNCCTMLNDGAPVYVRDVKRIARHLGLSVYRFLRRYCRIAFREVYFDEGPLVIPMIFTCVFYSNHSKACSIHDVKPNLCLLAPFISLLIHSEKMIAGLEEHCEGFGFGPEVSRAEIEKRLKLEEALEEEDYQQYRNGFLDKLIAIYYKEEEYYGHSS